MTTPLPFPGNFGDAQFYLGGRSSGTLSTIPINIPDGARFVEMFLSGPGGNGGAGFSGVSGSPRGGGGSGGPGAQAYVRFPTFLIPKTIYLALGAKGSGNASALSINPEFSSHIVSLAAGGTGGTGSSTAAGIAAGASGASRGFFSTIPGATVSVQNGVGGVAGGIPANGTGGTIGPPSLGTGWGGSGGGGVTSAGQYSGAINITLILNMPRNLQAAPGEAGPDGYSLFMPFPFFTGGSGGGSADNAPGGKGGDGGPGCGGGGGGGGTTGGAGGLGGPGYAFVWFS